MRTPHNVKLIMERIEIDSNEYYGSRTVQSIYLIENNPYWKANIYAEV